MEKKYKRILYIVLPICISGMIFLGLYLLSTGNKKSLKVTTDEHSTETKTPVSSSNTVSTNKPFSITKGKVIYHSYTDYPSGDSKMYMFNFSTKTLTCLSDPWTGVYNCMNASFSPDGKRIVFMGFEKDTDDWNIFLYTFGQDQPVNLTKSNGFQNEDPKFSPDGNKVIIKQTKKQTKNNLYRISEIDLKNNITRDIFNGHLAPTSMPYYSVDGSKIYYVLDNDSKADIYSVKVDGTDNSPVCISNNIQEYYPIAKDINSFYYTMSVSETNDCDQIYVKNTLLNTSVKLPFNESNSNFSDACQVDGTNLILSSTKPGGKGCYDLYIGNQDEKNLVSFNKYNKSINTSLNELGATYNTN